MKIARRCACFVALLPALICLPAAAQRLSAGSQILNDAPLPEAAPFLRQVREAIRLDDELQQDFMYVEERRDVRISRLGKVDVGPRRTFEVYPSSTPGRTYKRLIAIEGKPLAPAELARRDREHEENLRKAAEREKNETPAERARRLEKIAEADEESRAIVEDGLAVFEPRLVRRELLDGHRVIVVTVTPRQHAAATTREGRWMKQFEGTVWVSEADHEIVKLDMRAIDDVTIGWGILGRVHEGSRFVFVRRKVEDVWLPARISFDATGRTLLLRKFQLNVVTTYSGYKRIS